MFELDQYQVAFLNEPWIIKVFVVLFLVSVIHFFAQFLLQRFVNLSSKTASYWDDVLSHAAIKPVILLIWVVGLYFVVLLILDENNLDYASMATKLRDVGITFAIAWFFWRLADDAKDKYLKKSIEDNEQVDTTTVDALNKLVHLIVLIVSILAVMQTLGFSVSGVLAAGGIGGIAIGFAAKDLLANFFGGLTIYLDRPFSVGEWIRSPDKDIEGVVEFISWRHTRIRRFNKNALYVPNSVFTTIVVENPSRMTNRRIKETIGVRYDDILKVEHIVRDVKAMLEAHQAIDQNNTLIVNFNAFNASSVDFFIYTFTKTKVWEEYHAVKQDVLLKVAEIVEKHGAEMAFPTQTLHIASNESGTDDT